MDNEQRRMYLQSAKELRSYLRDSEKYRASRIDQAFVQWYADARFGKNTSVTYFDGPKDGGIDAIIEDKGRIFVLQMKYEKVPKFRFLKREDLALFEKVARMFRTENDNEFEEWLETVQPNAAKHYRDIRKKTLKDRETTRFIIVTTKQNKISSTSIEVEEILKMLALWNLFQEGFTPPAEKLILQMEDAWSSPSVKEKFRTYVGLTDVKSFRDFMRDDPQERLFAQNIRTEVRSETNRHIQETFESEPNNFWLGNNGIYIVAKSVKVERGNEYTLTFPSVINGYQTLKAVNKSSKRHSCKILVRILEMDVIADQELLSKIIKRTNTQNPIDAYNLIAHDPYQLNIARYLDRFHIYYERRKNEWTNLKRFTHKEYFPLKIKDLTKWLAVIHPDFSFGTPRRNPPTLINDENYSKLFSGYDADFENSAYKQLPLIVWSGLFVEALRKKPRSKSQRQEMTKTQLLLVAATFEALNSAKGILGDIEKKITVNELGRRAIPRKLLANYSKNHAGLVRIQKEKEKKESSMDLSNFFKRDDVPMKAYKSIFTAREIATLKRLLVTHLDSIK